MITTSRQRQTSSENQLFWRWTNLDTSRNLCIGFGFGWPTWCTCRDFTLASKTLYTHRTYQTQQALSLLNNHKTLASRYGDLVSLTTRPREFGLSVRSIARVTSRNSNSSSNLVFYAQSTIAVISGRSVTSRPIQQQQQQNSNYIYFQSQIYIFRAKSAPIFVGVETERNCSPNES